jgi:hypothetical protein
MLKVCFVIGLIAVLTLTSRAQETNASPYKTSFDDIIASCLTTNLDLFEKIDLQRDQDQRRLINKLLGIFKDPKSSRLNQCAAAHYLGELHASMAVRALSEKITLNYVRTGFIDHMSNLGAAVEVALIQIGTPSIPAMIRNLEESDDASVRGLSLKVLYRIEDDKDIVQLRLQKAITAQKDSNKTARLQAALKALAETQFDK